MPCKVNCTSTLRALAPKQMVTSSGGTTVTGPLKVATLDSPWPEQQDDCAVAAICSVKGVGNPAVGPAGQR